MSAVPAHPKYVSHFVDPLYDSNILDSAPFGSDQGADMLHDVEMAGGVLPPDASIETVLPWGDVAGYFAAAQKGDVDGLLFIYAAGFLLLRFNGHIEEADYRILRAALVGLANDLNLDDIRTTVLPDLDAFMAQRTDA
jgi:hypothetical protein